METKYHAIEIIGTGRNARYVIRQVVGTMTFPCSRPFRTEDAARKAAADQGIEITKVGTHYEII